MTAKEEITRRLKKTDYNKMSKELFDKNFDQLSDIQYKGILKIADIYGTKYKRFYKLKDSVNLSGFMSAFVSKNYTPSYIIHTNLTIIGAVQSGDGFTIRTEFYTSENVLVDVEINGVAYKQNKSIPYRRSMIIEKERDSNYLLISIDPIGEGSKVYKKLDENLDSLNTLFGLDIGSYFDTIEIDKAVYELIEKDELTPNRTVAKEESTKRVKSIYAKAMDNIKDDNIYKSCIDNTLELENMKMRFKKESIEIYGKELLKISTRADQGITDELTKNIISVL
jgi:hypothetical protein